MCVEQNIFVGTSTMGGKELVLQEFSRLVPWLSSQLSREPDPGNSTAPELAKLGQGFHIKIPHKKTFH